jgi:hypothetical protein
MPRTDETGAGLLPEKFPTPRASDYKGAKNPQAMEKAIARGYNPNLAEYVAANSEPKLWPTPTAHIHKEGGFPSEYTRNTPTLTAEATEADGKPHSSGSLNPEFVEWLMGYPVGYTDLNS